MDSNYKFRTYIHRCVKNKELIKPIVEKLAQKIEKNVKVYQPYEKKEDKEIKSEYIGKRYDLCIYLKSLPVHSIVTKVRSLYGCDFSRDNSARSLQILNMYDDYPGTVIYDPLGYEAALILGKTLYIVFDLYSCSRAHAEKILENILLDYCQYLLDRDAFDTEMRNRTNGKSVERFVDCYNEYQSNIFDQRIFEMHDNVTNLKCSLVSSVRSCQIAKGKNDGGLDPILSSERISEVFDKLNSLSVDGTVTFKDHKVTVSVGQINIEHEDVIYDIGNFDITVNCVSGVVRCKNKTRSISGFAHPNIRSGEDCYFGDTTYGLAVLIGRMELETVFLMIIEYLKSYRKEDRLCDIERWPKKSE